MLLLLLPPLLLKLSQCFCIADHTLNSSNYRMEGGGMYLGIWMSVRVCVCVWVPSEYVCSDVDSFSVYCSILNQRIYFELCLCYHAYVTSTRIISTRLKLSFSLLPIVPAATAAAASLQTQLLYGQTIQSIQFMFNIWRVTKNKKNKQECLAIWMCVGFTSTSCIDNSILLLSRWQNRYLFPYLIGILWIYLQSFKIQHFSLEFH